MQVVIWIIIILVAIFLIWLLRKWIKRIIFIAILLALAFFIYGIFSPSWASRLWYNVRTFPQRITSWISDKKTFLDYDSYKLNIFTDDEKEKDNSDTDISVVEDKNKWSDKDVKIEIKEEPKTDTAVNVTNPSQQKPTKKSDSKHQWYSSDEVLAVINNYINKNLDDDTDILVRIDYDDNNSPERIILQTQHKDSNVHYVSIPRLFVKKVSNWLQHSRTSIAGVLLWENDKDTEECSNDEEESDEKSETEVEELIEIEQDTPQLQTTTQSIETNKNNWLTQSEIKEAEQISSILF